jgi:methionyl-tRNA formyltransferase
MGTPEAAVPSLRRCLKDGHEVVAVWTRPDRPAGRGEIMRSPPVKQFALENNLEVAQPKQLKTEQTAELFASYDADLAVVVAYGRILPPEFLQAPNRGCINVHFSLLPLYRGAAPVNWAIIGGETRTGVTTMFMEEKLDAGPILLQRETRIGEKETAPELTERLAMTGADLLSETLAHLDVITPRPQRNRDATFAPMLQKQNGQINWSNSAFDIERCVRGLQPWPNAYTSHRLRRLIILKADARRLDLPTALEGEFVVASDDELVVKCGEQTALRLIEVQPEGRRRMSARDFNNGAHLSVGEKLG